MKVKLLALTLFCLINHLSFSQQINCVDELTVLRDKINKDCEQLTLLNNEFKKSKDDIGVDKNNDEAFNNLKSTRSEIGTIADRIKKNKNQFNNLLEVCKNSKAINEEQAKQLNNSLNTDCVKNVSEASSVEEDQSTETQTYIYFNENQIIKEDVIKNDGIEGKILNDIISQTNQETYLGDVIIPKDGEEFYFYKRTKRKVRNVIKRTVRKDKRSIRKTVKEAEDNYFDARKKLKTEEDKLKTEQKKLKAKKVDLEILKKSGRAINLSASQKAINTEQQEIKAVHDEINKLEDEILKAQNKIEDLKNEKEEAKHTIESGYDAEPSVQKFEKLDGDQYKYKFKSIDVEIKDGNFFDIRVKVEFNNQIHLFENLISVSFFRYNRMAQENYLVYAQKQPYKIEDRISEIQDYRIRLSDVLYYDYKIGNNYIPSDLVLELPEKDVEGKQTNLDSPATYQIKEDTYLDKIIELRAYTDFFALFGEADNGLLQVEGSAKLYMFPYARPILRIAQFELFKSLTPYVNYARFEEGDRLVQATPAVEEPLMNPGTFDQKLDIIEKRYLTMGLNLNVFEIYTKKYPVKVSFFASVDYNITEVQNDAFDPENIKSLGLGGGINLASKRFNNFGFNYNVELKWYDFESFNSLENFNADFTVPVFKNEAEVYYHPSDNPNQAIFVRLRAFNLKGNTSTEAFYQFQFGYKFSLGSRSVNKGK